MFGALNRFISRLDSDSPSRDSDGHGAFGFQVLRNKNDEIPIEPWFDFVVGINGRQIDDPDPTLFATEVRNCAGSAVSLTIWSAKGQQTRTLSIPVPATTLTLGLTLQWTPLSSTEDVWHILDVLPNSPASAAGLLPYADYIVGTPSGIVRGEAGLGELVEDHLARPLRLYVYNHEYDVARLVTITPSRGWGGGGALGCVLGFGALHRLPPPLGEPMQGPGETLFETEEEKVERGGGGGGGGGRPAVVEQLKSTSPGTQTQQVPTTDAGSHFLVPADLASPPPPPLVPASSAFTSAPAVNTRTPAHNRSSGRKTRHAAVSPNKAFDEYFKEGEQRSKEEDFGPSSTSSAPKGTGALPPPPKAGGGGGGGGGAPPPLGRVETNASPGVEVDGEGT